MKNLNLIPSGGRSRPATQSDTFHRLATRPGIPAVWRVWLACLGLGLAALLPARAVIPDFYYQFITNNNVVSVDITGYYGTNTAVVVPAVDNGINLPVTEIDDYAFFTNTTITSVTVPSTVTAMGQYVFYGCTNLTSFTFPNGVTDIGYATFYGCTSLTNVTAPSTVTSVQDYAFGDCTALNNLVLPDSITSFGVASFQGCTRLTSLTLPANLVSLGDDCFNSCPALTSVSFPAGLTTLGTNVFYGCSKLASLNLPGSVASIGYADFADCTGLTNVTFNSGVASLGEYSFYDCAHLASVTLPASVTNLSTYAFSGCTNLLYALFEGNAPPANTNVFAGDTNSSFYVYYTPGTTGWTTKFDGVTTKLGTLLPFTFAVTNGLATITAYTGPGGAVTIPSTYTPLGKTNVYPVTAIGYQAFAASPAGSAVTSVNIPASVTTIGESAFEDCSSLTTVTLTGGLTTLGDYAFANCPSLAGVVLPNTTTNLGTGLFYADTGLASATLPATLGRIPDQMFYQCTNLTAVTFPTGVTGGVIGDYAFALCSALTSVTIPYGYTTLDTYVFYGCTSLTSVSLPTTLTSIGEYSFAFDGNLPVVTIPAAVTTLGDYSFEYCTNLASIYFTGNAPSATIYAFAQDESATVYYQPGTTGWGTSFAGLPVGSQLFSYTTTNGAITIVGYTGNGGPITIPATLNNLPVTGIAPNAFAGNRSLTSLTIPGSVTNLGSDAFIDCSGLTSLTLGNGLVSIGDQAFAGCSGLTSVTLPASLTSLGAGVFSGELGLTSISVANGNPAFSSSAGVLFNLAGTVLVQYPAGLTGSYSVPGTVTNIASYAFAYSILTGVSLHSSLSSIGLQAFEECTNLTAVTIPASVTSIGEGAFDGQGMQAITVAGGNPDYSSANGVLFNAAQTVLIQYPAGLPGSYTIPGTVTSLADYAFSGSTITNVTIPNSVTTLGTAVFAGCDNLVAFNVTSGNPDFSNSTGGVLLNKAGTVLLQFPAGLGGSYTVPNTVTNIGAYAFYACFGLTNVTVPGSVSSIGELAFYGCTWLTGANLSANLTSLGASAFAASGLQNVSLPASLTSVGVDAFDECLDLTNVTIPPSITTLGDGAFASTALANVSLPYSITNLGYNAFADCPNLTNVCFEGNAPVDGGFVFGADNALTNVLYISGNAGWGLTYEGLPTEPCTQCGTYIPLMLAFTAPTPGEHVTTAAFTVTGTASDIATITNVYFSLNNGTWTNATTANHWTNWTHAVTLLPGTNLLSIYAKDSIGVISATDTVSVVYVTPLSVAITTPTAGQILTNSTFTVTGTASNKWSIAGIWVSLNSGSPVLATGTTSWSASLTPILGTNTVTVYAADPAGDQSTNASVKVVYQPPSSLTILTNGLGSFTGATNGQALNVGRSYTITAVPAGGFKFVSWTNGNSSAVTTTPALTFTMQATQTLIATFADTNRPVVSITNMPGGLTVSNALFTVMGTATDNWSVASVWVRVGNGTWSTAIGTKGWSASELLVPGTNTVYAYAVDTSGNYSATNSATVNYVLLAPLSITTNGLGTLSTNLTAQPLRIGQNYTVTATPAGGFKFVSWTNGLTGAVSNTPALTFTMASNLSLTVTFADTNRPVVNITNMASGLTVSSSAFTVLGTATDNWAVASVWVQLGTSGWFQASGTNKWSAPVTLVPGTNTISAYSIDTSGNISPTNSATVFYAVPQTLTVSTNGLGTLTPNDANAALNVGQNYTLTATPAGGFKFVSWTNNLTGAVSNTPALTFTMASNLSLTVTFADTNRPVVSITNMASGLTVSNSAFTVLGTATDNWAVASVWVQLGTSGWFQASGSNQWSAPVTLVPGTNTISAYSIDTSGNISPTNSATVNYVLLAPLTITTNGLGTLSTNLTAQPLRIGQNYTVTATPAGGFKFVSWTNNLTGAVSNTAALNFTMVSNLSLTVTFADTNPPAVSITNATTGLTVSNALYTVMGTATDNWQVASVYYQLNTTGWSNAIGTKNWSAPVSLTPGTNTFAVYAVDNSGNHSLTNTTVINYATYTLLTIYTNGLGGITPNDLGRQLRIGTNYTLVATPAAGFKFVNWTNNTTGFVTNSPTLNFQLQTNQVLTVTFAETNHPSLTVSSAVVTTTNVLYIDILLAETVAQMKGTSTDSWQVSGVWCRVNSGAWSLATTTNNFKNWATTNLPAVIGTNILQAYAVDAGGNYSATNSTTVVYGGGIAAGVRSAALVTPDQSSLVFNQPLLTPQGLSFSLQVTGAATGSILVSPDLSNWSIWTNFSGTNTTLNYTDPVTAPAGSRFYRAVAP